MHRLHPPRWLVVAVGVLAVAAAIVTGAAYGYARSQRDVVAHGIRVGAISLGGLSACTARVKLERAYPPLERPVVLRYPGARLVLTAREAKVSVDTEAMVAGALDLSRRPWFLPRAWRELTGGEVEANLTPHVGYSPAAVERVVRELQRRIRRPPENAVLAPSFNRLLVKHGHRGVAVAVGSLRRRIEKALVSTRARRLIVVPIRHPRPKVTVAVLRRRYPSYITIDRSAFTLRVYDHLRFVRSYPIAVGQVGLQTPAGVYHIQNKTRW